MWRDNELLWRPTSKTEQTKAIRLGETMIKVYISRKNKKPTATDLVIRKIVEKLINEEQHKINLPNRPLDVVIFDEPTWLEHFPETTTGVYRSEANSSVGKKNALLGLRGIYLTKFLKGDTEKIRSLIKHELVHIHIDPDNHSKFQSHGKEFRKHAKRIGLVDRFKNAKGE